MYQVHLIDPKRQELQRRAHAPGIRLRARDRLEMVRLADAGWSVPQIARHLEMCEKSVRHRMRAFVEEGFDVLRDQPPPGRTSRLTPAIREAVRQEFAKGDRTWTAQEVAEWIAQRWGVSVSVPHLRRLLRDWKLPYKCTGCRVKHKRKPDGTPQGRRVNGIGAYCTHRVEAGCFVYEPCASLPKNTAKKRHKTPEEQAAKRALRVEQVGTINAERFVRFVRFVWQVAGRPAVYAEGWQRERSLVADKHLVHECERVQQEMEAYAAAGITWLFVPRYSPELSGIEPIWHDVQHHQMTKRSDEILGELSQVVDDALIRKARDLIAAHSKHAISLRPAALRTVASPVDISGACQDAETY